MASSSAEINKKRCIKCDGEKCGGGLFTCDGCQQMFCGRHVSEHRQELSLQLENTMQEHDLIQQESNQFVSDQSVLEKINIWEKESIEKIKKTAEIARADFYQCQTIAQEQFKKKCNEFGENLRIARRTDDFSEPDLIKWNQTLTNLKTQLESMTKINITEDRRSSIILIKIQQNIHESRNIPVQRSLYSTTANYLNSNNQLSAAPRRPKNQSLQNSSPSSKPKETESGDNPDRQQKERNECKQQ
jgi:hypothetical protein